MIEHSRAELPNECCGLLAGHIKKGEWIADAIERYELINEMKSPSEFVSEPRSHLNAERDIRGRGLEVLAVYHSHPTSEPIPSKRDLERNYSERVMNLIIGLAESAPKVRAWWLTESRYDDAEIELVSNPQSEIQNAK